MLNEKCKESKVLTSRPRFRIIKYIYICVLVFVLVLVFLCVRVCVCVCLCVCECNVVNATLLQRYLESTLLRCDNVITTLPQPKDNVVKL